MQEAEEPAPAETPTETLARRLHEAFGSRAALVETDVYSADGSTRNLALDAIAQTQGDFPVVLVDTTVACLGEIDVERVLDAVARASVCAG